MSVYVNITVIIINKEMGRPSFSLREQMAVMIRSGRRRTLNSYAMFFFSLNKLKADFATHGLWARLSFQFH